MWVGWAWAWLECVELVGGRVGDMSPSLPPLGGLSGLILKPA